MILEHILKNLLVYFGPALLGMIMALATNKITRIWKKRIGVLCTVYFVAVIAYSYMSMPGKESLQIEWAFYALQEKPDSTYVLSTLLGEGKPTHLGFEDTLSKVKSLSTVHSGEQAQMRIRLNRRGYVYLLHFDTASNEVRQLFPSEDIEQSNPIPPDGWIEFPTGSYTWTFNQQEGLETFVGYFSTEESDDVRDEVKGLVDEIWQSQNGWDVKLDSLHKQLRSLALSNSIDHGEEEYAHGLPGVMPPTVKTRAYLARDGESALLIQVVQHKP